MPDNVPRQGETHGRQRRRTSIPHSVPSQETGTIRLLKIDTVSCQKKESTMIALSFIIVLLSIIAINVLEWLTRPKQMNSAEQKKRIDELLMQWKINKKKSKDMWAERLARLNSSVELTDEEKEERENMRAKEAHRNEYTAMNKGSLPHYNVKAIYSAEVRRKDEEKCRGIPSSLGLNIPSKNPNTTRWDTEAEIRARAYIGTVFEWMSCDLMGEPTQERSYCMIRINGRKRWMYLTVTREKTEPLNVVLIDYIKTLDIELLFGIEPVYIITEKPGQGEFWNPDKQKWL